MTFKRKETRVILSEEASQEYTELNSIVGEEKKRGVNSSIHQTILRSIERVKEWLKNNPFKGEQVEKRKIPKDYTDKYGIDNLWRIDLADHWRLIYTLQSNDVEIISFVLNITDHRKYDKIFGYRKK